VYRQRRRLCFGPVDRSLCRLGHLLIIQPPFMHVLYSTHKAQLCGFNTIPPRLKGALMQYIGHVGAQALLFRSREQVGAPHGQLINSQPSYTCTLQIKRVCVLYVQSTRL
jgi:hypothetical protein